MESHDFGSHPSANTRHAFIKLNMSQNSIDLTPRVLFKEAEGSSGSDVSGRSWTAGRRDLGRRPAETMVAPRPYVRNAKVLTPT